MTDIPQYAAFTKIEPLNKGWSSDKKYYVETADGERLLLRVADIAEYERRKAEFENMQRVAALGIPMQQPVQFGTCNSDQSVYLLLTWVDGEDAAEVLPTLTETEQYALGVKSGEILRKIHAIPAPNTQEDWAARFNRKADRNIKAYHDCGLRFDGDDAIIAYLTDNRHLLENRPQCYQHGDYHVGNMLIPDAKTVAVIDWNRDDYGDPWEEFNRIVWSAQCSPHFATGQLRGYFSAEPPLEFWQLLAFYIGSNTISSIAWAIPFGQGEVDTMTKQSQNVLAWYDNLTRVVPSWFLRDLEGAL
jgi:serine/threonine-protein kinase